MGPVLVLVIHGSEYFACRLSCLACSFSLLVREKETE